MKTQHLIYLLSIFFFISCNQKSENDKFKTADSGLQYQLHESFPNNEKPGIDDVVVLDLIYETTDGNLLFDSHDSDRTYMRTIKGATHPGGSLEDGLNMMNIGDSASFKINAQDFFRFTLRQENLPENVSPNDYIIVHVRMKNMLKKEEYSNQLDKNYHASEEMELELLENYLKITNVTVEPTESGLYYVPIQAGSGDKAKSDDKVSVHYTGSLISGKVFDSSIGKSPIQFTLGKGQVIPGWDEGIAMMKKGEKAKLIIPSKLAYGKRGKGENILPYSTLVFDVELINIQ
ncbi:MAG: FKBP-type peptidyl-prolyl cis-trans isomerase [Bacteroidales bacterium]|jgi:FKBP-type peptidyl-prolyl cis-trans isomerase FkpA|nr:FKBP-type peptidyl-prolyl cis-trans isomerase [Bacteroidales bacterium]